VVFKNWLQHLGDVFAGTGVRARIGSRPRLTGCCFSSTSILAMSPNRPFPSPFPALLERPNLPHLDRLALRERGTGWMHALRLHRLTSEITTASCDRAFSRDRPIPRARPVCLDTLDSRSSPSGAGDPTNWLSWTVEMIVGWDARRRERHKTTRWLRDGRSA
jgi:hypothetical protein